MNARNAPQKRGQSSNSQPSKGRGQRRRYQGRPDSERKDRPYRQKRNNRSYRNPSRQRSSNSDSVIKRYGKILELHLAARKKHHDLFHKADPQQKTRLEKNYYQTLENLRKFEEGLKPEEKELFFKEYRSLNPDTTYSNNHELSKEGEAISGTDFEDPHFLPSQRESSFSEDTEESTGTIEDYNKIKGL